MNRQTTGGLSLVLLRLSLGLAFLTTWLSNFQKGVFTNSGYVNTLRGYIENAQHIDSPFDFLVRDVLIPNVEIFLLFQIMIELIIWVSLVFGLFTRACSLLGAFLSFSLLFLALGIEWPWTYILMIAGFVVCAWTSAGRWYGVDFWLQKKLPGSLRKILI